MSSDLLKEIRTNLKKLIESFKLGNVIKNGIPVTILGAPNVGKSTLLNCLLNEEKAIVSDISGTTRDAIEDNLVIEGYNFRFIDTAGIRNTSDTIENLGIKKSLAKAESSEIILFLIDASAEIQSQVLELEKLEQSHSEKIIVVLNKNDIAKKSVNLENTISISSKNEVGIDILKQKLLDFVYITEINDNESIVTNLRHYEELSLTLHEIETVIDGINNGISGDLLSINIRQALFHLGSITGEVTTDDLLGNIFSRFCIGK